MDEDEYRTRVWSMFDKPDLSFERADWKPELEVTGLASQVMHYVGYFRDKVSEYSQYADPTNPTRANFFMPEDMDVNENFVAMVHDVLQNPYLPHPTGKKTTEISQAMGLPFKVVLTHELLKRQNCRVLVIGSGFGQDVRRVMFNSRSYRYSFELIEPDEERLKQSKIELTEEFPDVNIEYFNTTFEKCSDVISGQYDLILACNSFQFFAGRKQSIYFVLAGYLTDDGVVIGSYMDHDSFFSHSSLIAETYGGNVTVSKVLDNPKTKSMLGDREVKIFGTTFVEPYVTPEVINSFALHHGLFYNIYKGKGLLALARNDQCEYDRLRKTLKSPGVSLMTTVVMRRISFSVYPVVPTDKLRLSPQTMPFRHFSYNNAPHYRAGNYYYAKKRDGVRGIITLNGGVWHESWDDGCDDVMDVNISFDRPLYFMAEKTQFKIYLTDLLCESFPSENTPFILRYTYLETILVHINNISAELGKKIKINRHYPVRTVANIDMMELRYKDKVSNSKLKGLEIQLSKLEDELSQSDLSCESDYIRALRHNIVSLKQRISNRHLKGNDFEGYMLIPMVGEVWGGYQPGVKLKVRRTVDKLNPAGHIEEYVVDDSVPGRNKPLIPTGKLRPDKKNSDTLRVEKEIIRAVPWSEAFDLLRSEANMEFSWSAIGGIHNKNFIHPLNKAITADMWNQIYSCRSNLDPEIVFPVLNSLAYHMRELGSTFDPGDDPPDPIDFGPTTSSDPYASMNEFTP